MPGWTLDAPDLVRFLEAWLPHDSRFINQFKVEHAHRALIDDLRSDGGTIPPLPGAVPPIPSVPSDRRVVIVRTLKPERLRLSPIPVLRANFFGRVTVAGQTFVEAMRLHDDAPDLPWTTLKFLPASDATTPVRYEIWNEGGLLAGADQMCRINPLAARKHLEFVFDVTSHASSGDISGVHDTTAGAARSEASVQRADTARLTFYVMEKPLQ